MTIFGIDVASYQGHPDWNKVQGSGITYGFAKATQGTTYTSSAWEYDQTELMRLKNFLPGAYHFLSATDDPVAQARYFVSKLACPDTFAVALDVERYTSGGQTQRPTAAMAREWVEEFRKLVPGHPIIGYFPRWYWVEQNKPDLSFLDSIWASAYVSGSGTPDQLYPKVTDVPWSGYGGRNVAILQYSSNGAVPGVVGPVDLDAYRGTLADLQALTLPHSVPEPSPEPVPETPVEQVPRPSPLLSVDGGLGPKTVRALQSAVAWHLKVSIPTDGFMTRTFVRHLQRYLRVDVDGVLGPKTKKAIQKKVKVSPDGVLGPVTIRALQRSINTGAF